MRALFLHGKDGNPENYWFPYLKDIFTDAGYEVFAPHLPNNHTPNAKVYEEFLKTQSWDYSDNVIVGHSSGATTALNLLQSDWMPKARAAVLAGVFLDESLVRHADWYEEGQFEDLFPDEFDVDLISSRCVKFYFVHGDDDPFCSYNRARDMCNKLGGQFITIPHGGHLGGASKIVELPSVAEKLTQDGIL